MENVICLCTFNFQWQRLGASYCVQFLNGSMKLRIADPIISQPSSSSPCQPPLNNYYNPSSSCVLYNPSSTLWSEQSFRNTNPGHPPAENQRLSMEQSANSAGRWGCHRPFASPSPSPCPSNPFPVPPSLCSPAA